MFSITFGSIKMFCILSLSKFDLIRENFQEWNGLVYSNVSNSLHLNKIHKKTFHMCKNFQCLWSSSPIRFWLWNFSMIMSPIYEKYYFKNLYVRKFWMLHMETIQDICQKDSHRKSYPSLIKIFILSTMPMQI